MKTTITGEYIKEMLNKGAREDARRFLDYRPVTLKIGTITTAEGSAEAHIGNTRVLAGVKVVVATPMPDKPKDGNLVVGAELLPLASEEFDIGPPTPEAIELARVVDRGIRAANVVDLSKLFIEDEKVWGVFVDVYVLNYDGNLFDASTLAAMAALQSAKMPKYEDGKVIRDENMGKLPISNIVTSSTFGCISDKVLLDPSGNEELFIDARLTIANDEKCVRAMQKGLSGGITPKEVEQMLEVAFEKSKGMRDTIKKAIGE